MDQLIYTSSCMFGDLTASDLVTLFIVILIAMSFHEAMHAFVGHWLGDDTARREGRLTLNPLKHIDPFMTVILPLITLALFQVPLLAAKPVPFNPDRVKYDEFGAALIAAAGPFSNLLLAVVGASIFKLSGIDPLSSLYQPVLLFIQVNIALFVFNLIPFPPLDGSRVLYAFAPEPLQKAMEYIESFGFMAILLIFFVLLPFLSPIISSINLAIYRFLV